MAETEALDRLDGLTIADILSPLSEEQFVNEYMGKKAVHLPGSAPIVQKLIDKDGVMALCKNPKADVFAGVIDDKKAFHQILINNENSRHMYATGWSLQVEELHLLNPAFMDLCHLIRDGLGIYSGMEAGVMLSQPGKGYPFHFDPNPDVWIFQIFGRKKWRFYQTPQVDRPIAYAILPKQEDRNPYSDGDPYYKLGRPKEDDLVEVILEPGDVFYFPGGTWHMAEAQEECCHVIVASTNSPWTDPVFDVLKKKLLQKSDWRQVPEESKTSKVKLADELNQRIAELKEIVNGLDAEELLAAIDKGRESRRSGSYRQS